MRKIMLAFLVILSGCAQWSAVKGGVVDEAAAVSDEALRTSEFMMCRGVTVGAWVRAFGQDAGKAQAWRVICGTAILETPVK